MSSPDEPVGGGFLRRCGRCFLSIRTIPSFVKGLASTSFIPRVSISIFLSCHLLLLLSPWVHRLRRLFTLSSQNNSFLCRGFSFRDRTWAGYSPQWKYVAISSPRMFDVIATMGTRGDTSRMHAVAETPSNTGMMMSKKMRSNCSASSLTLATASDPSFCIRASVSQSTPPVAVAFAGTLTAVSTLQSTCVRNLEPILMHTLSSSTRSILGFVLPHSEPPASLEGGGVICGGASAMWFGLLKGRV